MSSECIGGVRRYQNPDGSYKRGAEGRYNSEINGNKRIRHNPDYEKVHLDKSRKLINKNPYYRDGFNVRNYITDRRKLDAVEIATNTLLASRKPFSLKDEQGSDKWRNFNKKMNTLLVPKETKKNVDKILDTVDRKAKKDPELYRKITRYGSDYLLSVLDKSDYFDNLKKK